MFFGDNVSCSEFEVIDEDFDVLGAFTSCEKAIACANSAPWWHGEVRIRRDRGIVNARHQRAIANQRERLARAWWLLDPVLLEA